MSEILITVDHIGKKFSDNLKRSLQYGLQDIWRELLPPLRKHSPMLREDEFWALSDVSFSLRRGESLGLIGRNGAGKTTLLRLLTGLIKLDEGRIELRGRIGALIALGAGFNPILTGRENIYANAAVLGFTKREIHEKLDAIIDFSELEDFIDMPVQNYSSGMKVRLGFSVAANMEPDILLIDEILAVGDAGFRSRCYQRISQLRERTCIVFVSHSLDQMNRVCDKALYLRAGAPPIKGEVLELYDEYAKDTFSKKKQSFLETHRPISRFRATLSGSILNVETPNLCVVLELDVDAPVNGALRTGFSHPSGTIATDVQHPCRLRAGTNLVELHFPVLPLRDGTYNLSFVFFDYKGNFLLWAYQYLEINVRTRFPAGQSFATIPNSELIYHE